MAKRKVGRGSACTQGDGCVQAAARAVGYIRVSTEEQARGGVSLDAQREKILAYCTLAGLTLDHLYSEEGVSGAKPLATRPAGGELVAAIGRRGGPGHVVAMKLDRLFRDAGDALNQTRSWDAAGVALHLIDVGGQAVNTSSPSGRFFLTVMAACAELERNQIADRTATALDYKKRHLRGYAPVPVGFSAVLTGNLTRKKKPEFALEANPTEQLVVATLRAWREQKWTLRRMAEELNARGVPTKRGGVRWHASTVAGVLANEIHDLPRAA